VHVLRPVSSTPARPRTSQRRALAPLPRGARRRLVARPHPARRHRPVTTATRPHAARRQNPAPRALMASSATRRVPTRVTAPLRGGCCRRVARVRDHARTRSTSDATIVAITAMVTATATPAFPTGAAAARATTASDGAVAAARRAARRPPRAARSRRRCAGAHRAPPATARRRARCGGAP